jgi:hypothetical protein
LTEACLADWTGRVNNCTTLVDHSSVSSLHQTGSEHSLSEGKIRTTLPDVSHLLSRAGRNIVANIFARVDRSGRIVKTKSNIERERKKLVQMDSESLKFDNELAVTQRLMDRALSNVRAEEEEFQSEH